MHQIMRPTTKKNLANIRGDNLKRRLSSTPSLPVRRQVRSSAPWTRNIWLHYALRILILTLWWQISS